jgi:hypothetical protein
MNLKLKYALLIPAQSVIPFVMLICGPYVGLVPKSHHMRIAQLVGGILTIIGLGLAQYFLGYERERDLKKIFADIRARGSRTVSISCDDYSRGGGGLR